MASVSSPPPRWLWIKDIVLFLSIMIPLLSIWSRISTLERQLYEINFRFGDRWTASMYIDAQDRLSELNPGVLFLGSREVREIQTRGYQSALRSNAK